MGNIIDFLKDNFFHIAPILTAGFFGIAIIIERSRALIWLYPMRSSSAFFERISDLVMANHISDAVALCEKYSKKPVARVVKEALLRAHQPESLLKDGLELAVADSVQLIQLRTPYLATIANVATLLGLLGTILGLIHSFEALGSVSAQQKATFLAAGISTAMNATMMGLLVAVPCMVAFSYLSNKTNILTSEVEKSAIRMIDLLNQRYFESESKTAKTGSRG